MNPLDQLQDIHLPEPVSWWPLAPFWWLLIALLLGVCAILIWRSCIKHKRNAYRREALKILTQLSPTSTDAHTVNKLLKATAITCYGKEHCADLCGDQWLTFLQYTAPKAAPMLASDEAKVLGELGYQAQPQYDPEQLWHIAKAWLQSHRQDQLPVELMERHSV